MFPKKWKKREMNKTSKSRFFLLIILLSMLLLASTQSFMPAAHATEPTIQEKSISILNNVAGIDLTKYNVTSKTAPAYRYFDAFLEDNTLLTLESQSSKIDVLCTFAKGKLHILNVLETEGAPSMTRQAPNVAAMATSFLNDYADFSGNALYNDLSLTLNDVNLSKNSTATVGNVKLRANVTTNYVTFSWIYTSNGVDAAEKSVALGYKNGFLNYFLDTWDLYKVGSTTVNLSKDEAVAIAMKSAKTFSYKVGSGNDTFEVKDFNITRAMVTQLLFCSSIGMDKARGDDALTIYPMWRIGIGLDKFYPGNVYGIYVDIWADTKEVKQVQEVFSTLPPELVGASMFDEKAVGTLGSTASGSWLQSDFAPSIWFVFAVVFVAFGAVPIWLRLKKSSWRIHNFPVLRSTKITVGLLCFILFSAILMTPMASISLVNADSRCATIWGDRDYSMNWTKPGKTVQEQGNQTMLASYLAGMFNTNGYDASNYQGDDTVKTNILAQICSGENNYDKAAVVYFDHGVGSNAENDDNNWHYQVSDNDGVPVYDMEIFNETQGKTFFALINTCMSANLTFQGDYYETGNMVGMPYAFTHQQVPDDMSLDGYGEENPYGDCCYIGFPYGSASLSQPVDDNLPNHLYWMWVYSFFWYALHYDITVNSALDQASIMVFNDCFGYTDLHNGFKPIWGAMDWKNYDSTMVVYGDGNIKLYHPYAPSQPEVYGPTEVTRDGEYNFSACSYDLNLYDYIRYNFTWGDDTYTLTDWDYHSGDTAYASHIWSSTGEFNVTVSAQDSYGLWSSPSDPLTVTVVPPSPPTYLIHVTATDELYNELNPNVWIDGNYAGTAPFWYPAAIGEHTVEVDNQIGNEYFAFFSGFSWYTNPIAVEVVSDNVDALAVYCYP